MTVGRQTNAGGGLIPAEFPKKLPEALRYSEEIWNLLPLCSRGAPHGPLQFRPGQEVREVRLQQICLRLVVCGASLPHIGDEDQALLLLRSISTATWSFRRSKFCSASASWVWLSRTLARRLPKSHSV